MVALAVLEVNTTLVVISVLVVIVAWLTARSAKRKGYNFGSTLIMALIGLASVALVLLNLITYLFR